MVTVMITGCFFLCTDQHALAAIQRTAQKAWAPSNHYFLPGGYPAIGSRAQGILSSLLASDLLHLQDWRSHSTFRREAGLPKNQD
jgi:hypothetical protein